MSEHSELIHFGVSPVSALAPSKGQTFESFIPLGNCWVRAYGTPIDKQNQHEEVEEVPLIAIDCSFVRSSVHVKSRSVAHESLSRILASSILVTSSSVALLGMRRTGQPSFSNREIHAKSICFVRAVP